jgi:hypothetical protein
MVKQKTSRAYVSGKYQSHELWLGNPSLLVWTGNYITLCTSIEFAPRREFFEPWLVTFNISHLRREI